MKVLLVNCVYGFGSTGKIMQDIVRGLEDSNITPVVAYARGVAPVEESTSIHKLAPEWVIKLQSLASKVTGYSYDCSPFSTRSLFRLIEEEKPDVVNLHCVNANTLNLAATIGYLKKHHIKTCFSIHAEFPYTGGCGHAYDCEQWKDGCTHCEQFKSSYSQLPLSYFFDKTAHQWKQLYAAYKNFEELVVTCVSPWLAKRAEQSPFFKGRRILSIKNGLNPEIFRPRDTERLRQLHKLQGKKVILHVTPNFYLSLKGGNYVLDIAKRLEQEHPEYRMIVCGYNGDGYDLPSNVIPVRFTKNQEELAEYYSLADATLLTSRRETFSMVTSESLCCGTPVIGFEAGGPESIAMSEYSHFVTYGDIETLYRELVNAVEKRTMSNVNVTQAANLYSLQTMAVEYKKLYKNMCSR